MIEFHDYDPANPFAVTGETQTIADGKVTLNYTPLQGSVSITGFTETTSKTPAKGEFYIDYSAGTEYRMATQVVVFNTADNGTTVTASYSGVSTLIRAKHFNEIKSFMEGAVSYSQVTKMTATAGEVVKVPITNTTTFCKPPVEVLKFKAGTTNTVVTECDFNNADGTDFVYDSKYITFDGTMHPVFSYAVAMSTPTALGSGYLSTSDEFDVSAWKTMESIDVKTTGEIVITSVALSGSTWTQIDGEGE